ncbi:DUF3822 family protein [Lutimonas sp.]|uniref:DUF3822 family protein n=1 Tax=Lutimonas sp. TaxID=1872403 RepID=UPI003D9BF601
MMDLKKNQKTKSSLDFNNLIRKHLSIQLSLDGFSFCIINKDEKQIEKLTHIDFEDHSATPDLLLKNVENVFKKDKALQKRYGSVNITHVNQLSTLVPKSLFDEARIRDYLKFSSKTYTNDYVVHDDLENHDMVNVYIPFVNVNNFFLERFGSFEYKHFSTVLVDKLLNTFKFSEHPHMFAHIGAHQFEIIVIAHDQLLFYNSFEYHTPEDFIYYVLFTAEQLSLNPETFELVLAGMITQEAELFKMAYRYIRKVSLLENRSEFKFPPNSKEETKRRHFTLLNQYS